MSFGPPMGMIGKNENRIVPFLRSTAISMVSPAVLNLVVIMGWTTISLRQDNFLGPSEYTGSVTDYLNSDAASTWREDIVPLCQLNYESAAVILTDRAESMYSFNTGDEALLSGRFLQAKSTQTVMMCVISAAYAEQKRPPAGRYDSA